MTTRTRRTRKDETAEPAAEAETEATESTEAEAETATETNVEFVQRLVAEADRKISVAKLRAHLLIEDRVKNEKEANAVIKEAGFAASRGRTGFRAELYERLLEGPLSQEEFASMLVGQSKNTKVHKKHYWGIVDLLNRVWAKVEAEAEVDKAA